LTTHKQNDKIIIVREIKIKLWKALRRLAGSAGWCWIK